MEENKYGYLYVLDFLYSAIYEIKLTEEDQELTSDKILKKYGLKESTCNFMYTENKLELEILKE